MTTDNLPAEKLFVTCLGDHLYNDFGKELQKRRIVALSPDASGFKRTTNFGDRLAKYLASKYGIKISDNNLDTAVLTKLRDEDGHIIKGKYKVIGDVEDALVISYDDMISTLRTSYQGYEAAVNAGGEVYALCAPHGFFAGDANEYLRRLNPGTRVIVSDTMEPWRLDDDNRQRVEVISVTKLVADAIWRIHSTTGSISELLS